MKKSHPKKSETPSQRSQEIELKLALPTSDPTSLAKKLARSPLLARRKATHKQLHNIYYDTPEQRLHRERIALRLRRVGSDEQPQWLQTLKTGGRSDSALSQRGEWELPVAGAELSLNALKTTPWTEIDPDGTVFRALAPCFVTTFERTSWLVRRRDGSVVEVALDIGHVEADGKRAPICELELELLAGKPAALFEIAQQIATTLAVLPANMSKAERGYALAREGLDLPRHAQPTALSSKLPLVQTAQLVMREMLAQFTSNLNALRTSNDPEVVHQARVGWRRFKSARRLFRPILAVAAVPSWEPLQALLSCLGELRDLDVASCETLPPLAEAYIAGDARRVLAWQAMQQALAQAVDIQHKAVRYALQEPTVGACLLATTQWLEGLTLLSAEVDVKVESKKSLNHWASRQVIRLHRQFQQARHETDNPENLHRARIFAKRMRYGIESLRPVLPQKRIQRWYQQATRMQTRLGTARDVAQAGTLVAKLELDRGLVEFLRGVAVGRPA